MKKLLLPVFLFLFASFTTFANDADLFKFDYNSVQSEFAELNQLGVMVTANANLTYTDLKLTNENLLTSLRLVPESALPSAVAGEPVAGIPSFLWGCILGPIGLALVYIGTEKDKEETRKALWGCVASTGSYIVIWVIYYVVVVAAVTSTI